MSVSARLIFRTLILVSAFAAVSLPASERTPARLYEVITETGMPHLEEKSASLADCKLRRERRDAHVDSYLLVCAGGHGTTGNASWRLGEPLIVGQLDVKLGGKNMTFFQRVTAKPLGQCS